MHGEYKHLIAQAKIAEELGYDSDHIKILSSGDVLEIDENGAEVTGHVPVGNVMVDGLGVGDVGNIVLRDRQRLAEDGIIIVVMTLENGTGQVLAGPDIVSRGFVYVRNSESLMDEAKPFSIRPWIIVWITTLQIGQDQNEVKMLWVISSGKRPRDVR